MALLYPGSTVYPSSQLYPGEQAIAASGSLALTGSGTTALSAARPAVSVSAVSSGSGTLALSAPSPKVNATGLGLTGSGNVAFSAAAVAVAAAAASLTGSGTLATVATSVTIASSAASLAGSGVLTPSVGTPTTSGSLALSGSGSHGSQAGSPAVPGTLTLAGAGNASWVVSLTVSGALQTTGSGSLALSDSKAGAIGDPLAFSGSGQMALSAPVYGFRGPDTALTGSGSLALSEARVNVSRAVALTGSGTTALSGAAVAVSRALGLTGSGSTALTDGRMAASGALDLAGDGNVVTSAPRPAVTASLPLSGTGATGISGSGSASDAISLFGSGNLTRVRVPKMAELTDTFDSWNPTRYSAYYASPSDVSVVNGKLRAVPTGNYSGVEGLEFYDLLGSEFYYEQRSVPTGGSLVEVYGGIMEESGNFSYGFLIVDGVIQTDIWYAGAKVLPPLWSAPYNPELHRWQKVHEADGVVHLSTSGDGVTWTEQASEPSRFPLNRVTLYLGTGHYDQPPTGVTEWDNINTPPIRGTLALSGDGEVLASSGTMGTSGGYNGSGNGGLALSNGRSGFAGALQLTGSGILRSIQALTGSGQLSSAVQRLDVTASPAARSGSGSLTLTVPTVKVTSPPLALSGSGPLALSGAAVGVNQTITLTGTGNHLRTPIAVVLQGSLALSGGGSVRTDDDLSTPIQVWTGEVWRPVRTKVWNGRTWLPLSGRRVHIYH